MCRAIIFSLGLGLFAAVAHAAADSGGYRGPLRDGVFPVVNLPRHWPEGGPKLAWSYDSLGDGFGAPLVTADAVYVTGARKTSKTEATGTAFCFDLDGKLRWNVAYGPDKPRSGYPGPRATPTYSDGRIYIASSLADVYCLDAATGRTVWQLNVWKDLGDGGGAQRLGWGYNESPLVVGNLVIVNACSTSETGPPVVAVNQKTGKLAWKADPGEGNYSAADSSMICIEHAGRKMVIAHLVRAVLALDPQTGKTLWKLKPNGGHGMTPLHHGGVLLLGHKSGLRALRLSDDGSEPTVLWERTEFRREPPERFSPPTLVGYEPPIVIGNQVLCIKYRHTDITQCWWTSLDLKTGEEKWVREVESRGWPPPAPSVCVADGTFYLFENGPKCSLAKPLDYGFEVVSAFKPALGVRTTYTHPVVADGKLFLRQAGQLAVYDLVGPDAKEPPR